MAQEELELKPPIPTPIPPTFLGGGGAVSGCGCFGKKDILCRHPLPPQPVLPNRSPARGLPGGGVWAAFCWGLQAGARGHATPSRIPVTAEIAEIGCN